MKQVLYFSAQWCAACQTMKQPVESVSKQLGVPINKIDTDYDVSYTSEYNVKSVPTLILLENGKETKRIVGTQSESKIKEFING